MNDRDSCSKSSNERVVGFFWRMKMVCNRVWISIVSWSSFRYIYLLKSNTLNRNIIFSSYFKLDNNVKQLTNKWMSTKLLFSLSKTLMISSPSFKNLSLFLLSFLSSPAILPITIFTTPHKSNPNSSSITKHSILRNPSSNSTKL